MSKKIILLGYMGCGKSTIGAHIATSLSLPFQDLDVFIAEQEGKVSQKSSKRKEKSTSGDKSKNTSRDYLPSPTLW